MTFGQEFFFEMTSPMETATFAVNGPPIAADKKKAHYACFLWETQKLVDLAQVVNFLICQQLFWTKSNHWLKLDDGISAVVEPDFCTTDHISGEPFVTSADGVKLHVSKNNMAMTMEQKKSFAGTDQMEIVNCGERMLCIQRG